MLFVTSPYANMSFFEFAVGVALAALFAMGVFHHAHKAREYSRDSLGNGNFLAALVVVPIYFIRYSWLRSPR